MVNVLKPDVQIQPLMTQVDVADPSTGVGDQRRWPIVHGRTWRLVFVLGPFGVRIELERTEHAQS